MTVETPVRETPVAPEVVSPLKPSEAMRLGRLIRPRLIFGPLYDGEDGACAVGACMAAGLEPGDWPQVDTSCPEPERRHWWNRGRKKFCAAYIEARPWSVTVHLYEDHRWPTDRITVWLEGQGW